MKIFSKTLSIACLGLLAACGHSRNSDRTAIQAQSATDDCSILANTAWTEDISKLPVHPNSANFVKSIGEQKGIKADFGSGLYEGAPMGIPYFMVADQQAMTPVTFTAWEDESEPGPYPIPLNAPIEGGGDHHVIAVDLHRCRLYELFQAEIGQGAWLAANGAVFDLRSQSTPPRIGDAKSKIGWTSADAAGLPIFPGLVRFDEVKRGEINHALRFTVSRTQKAFIFPATHWASKSSDSNRPPMGLRLRLKADVDISTFSPENQVILRALKKYGMIVADNGSDWYISGAPDEGWNNDDLRKLTQLIKGHDFEAVDTGALQTRF